MYRLILLFLTIQTAVSSEQSYKPKREVKANSGVVLRSDLEYLLSKNSDSTQYKDNAKSLVDERGRFNYKEDKLNYDDEYLDNAPNRILQWFKNIFSKPDIPNITATTEAAHKNTNDTAITEATKYTPKELEDNTNPEENTLVNNTGNAIAEAVDRLTAVLEKLNQNILFLVRTYNPNSSPRLSFKRIKRDTKFTLENKDNLKVLKVQSSTNAAITKTDVQNATEMNTTTVTPNAVTETATGETVNRRIMFTKSESSSEIKNKLLTYLEVTFDEIVSKMGTISDLRQAFNNDDVYRIGYIVANIDNLHANLKNLKEDMETNKLEWDDKQIMSVFDKLIASNKVVARLLETLNMYSKNHSEVEEFNRFGAIQEPRN